MCQRVAARRRDATVLLQHGTGKCARAVLVRPRRLPRRIVRCANCVAGRACVTVQVALCGIKKVKADVTASSLPPSQSACIQNEDVITHVHGLVR